MTIGLVCPDSENPFYGRLMKLISHYSDLWGYSLVLAVSNNNSEIEAKIIKRFLDRRVDGIIVLPLDISRNESEVFNTFLNNEIPFVFSVSYYEGFEKDCVLTDYAAGSYEMTKKLLLSGHREIWYLVTRDPEIPVSKLRLDGYKKAYAEQGLVCKPEWIIPCEYTDGEFSHYITKKMLNERHRPDAICTLHDYMANGVRKAVLDYGYRIPEDISLVGYDDSFIGLFFDNPIATVRQDMEQIAKETVRMLLKRINPDFSLNEPIQQLIKPELVLRRTIRS